MGQIRSTMIWGGTMPNEPIDPSAFIAQIPDMNLEAWFIGMVANGALAAQENRPDLKQLCLFAVEYGKALADAARAVAKGDDNPCE